MTQPKSLVSVRLSTAELRTLRELPGETDSDRLRQLIRASERLASADRQLAEIRENRRLLAACFTWIGAEFKVSDDALAKLKRILEASHETE